MGASGSIVSDSKKYHFDGKVQSVFLDKNLLEATEVFLIEPNARASFSAYIKSGVWMDGLKKFEREQVSVHPTMAVASKEAWECFGYTVEEELEHVRSAKESDSLSDRDTTSTRSHHSEEEQDHGCDCASPDRTESSRLDCDVYPANSTCFTMNELCALMFAALYPLYRKSRAYQHWIANRHSKNFKESEEASFSISGRPLGSDLPERSHRLRDIFLLTAAYFDQSEFIAKLSKREWVRDYAHAMQESSVSFSLAEVVVTESGDDEPKRQQQQHFNTLFTSKAFDSTFKKGPNFTDFIREDALTEQTKHALFEALQNGSSIKTALPAMNRYGFCCTDMFAMQPLFNSRREYKYVLGVHCNVSSRRGPVTLCRVQFLEDILALFPMLVRF